ncbi:ssDNA endodeoxyribonuclease [Saccharomycopsis crataegensis]|uniref:SsDNA endodeoxyribonuclease n=1 Tax=Saccharomycopsis crataegensis TaxID=43959 RepID=A0AAV5QUC8_9ASCO|nr:ssDNA endodeoxyribonuclease [Saccharomycopsis crataegensis]
MGVTKLWKIVEESGKPVRLEALRKKRLAIDASIWVYQFLKAVRNKEGVGLRGSHIVGFFRRICKLLYFGIQPVFVFDGGAPVIKLNTIAKRRERREGQRQSAKGTAQKLLLLKLKKQRENGEPISQPSPTNQDDDLKSKIFKKEDEYHLPELEKFYYKKSDKRIISPDDYQKYVRSLDNDIEDIDLNNIDPASDEFNQLSLERQYIILHKLRLRSRLRMGYSKEQLQEIFPNSLDFSKFQIQMVKKRNFLTQKLLNVVGLDDNLPDVDSVVSKTRRLAGEKDQAYTLQRNSNGWSLSIDNKGNSISNAIKVDDDDDDGGPSPKKRKISNNGGSDDDDFSDIEWEEVKIKPKGPRENFSLNALPLPPASESMGSVASKVALTALQHAGKRKENRNIEQRLYDTAVSNSLKERDIEQHLYDTAVSNSMKDKEKKYQIELKKAIEQSKKELETIRIEQEQFLENDLFEIGPQENKINPTSSVNTQIPSLPKFSLGKSIFQKPLVQKNPTPEPKEPPNDFQENSEDDFSDDLEEIAGSGAKVSNEMPVWFDNNNEINVHNPQKYFPTQTILSNDKSEGESDEIIENFKYGEQNRKMGDDLYEEDQQVVELGDDNKEVIEINDDEKVIEINDDDTANEVNGNEKVNEVYDDEVANELKGNEKVNGINDNKDVIEVNDNENIDEINNIKEINGDDKISGTNNETLQKESQNLEMKEPSVLPERSTKVESSTVTLENEDSGLTISNGSLNGVTINNIETDKSKAIQGDHAKQKITHYDFEEDEEDEIISDLEREETAHNDFANNLRQQYVPTSAAAQSNFRYNEANLLQQHKRELRDSDEVTDQMIDEVKDLLTCFGIPYITAPMEAEAQCSELLKLQLVDGIVTDDSDCFLFGGDRIYRHMFTEKKFAEFYDIKDIDAKTHLSRDKMIDLAYLLGSDYTEGLKGIGPVTAVKIVDEFGSLKNFKDWCIKCQESNADKSKLLNTPFKKSLRKRLINNEVYLDQRFPDKTVKNAYLYPEVDSDKTNFVWGPPDLDMLRTYLMSKIGWSKEKVNEILIPLIRRYNSPW